MTGVELAGYPASLAMGLALGLTGGGGSILTVPILVYLFGVSPVEATAYSLLIVGLVALWGAIGAYKDKDLHLKSALAFGVPGVLGVVFSRRIILPSLPEAITLFDKSMSKNSMLLVAFSALMLAASISMIRSAFQKTSATKMNSSVCRLINHRLVLSLIGLVVGITAGFVGAGGGFLIVPALVSFARLEMRQAVGTSLFVISLQSLLGILGDYSALRAISIPLFTSVLALALVGMSMGTQIRHKISGRHLKLGFGVFVLLVGTAIFIREWY